MSIGALAVPLLIASTAVGVVGGIVQTSAAINASNYQASVAQRQAEISQDNAVRAEQAAQVEQQQQDEQTKAALGSILATQGASGLSVSGKSQLLTRKTAATLGRQDALNVRQAGDLAAYNYKQQSLDSSAAAEFAHQQASEDLLAGFLDAGSTILGGATSYLKMTPSAMSGTTTFPTTSVPKALVF